MLTVGHFFCFFYKLCLHKLCPFFSIILLICSLHALFSKQENGQKLRENKKKKEKENVALMPVHWGLQLISEQTDAFFNM